MRIKPFDEMNADEKTEAVIKVTSMALDSVANVPLSGDYSDRYEYIYEDANDTLVDTMIESVNVTDGKVMISMVPYMAGDDLSKKQPLGLEIKFDPNASYLSEVASMMSKKVESLAKTVDDGFWKAILPEEEHKAVSNMMHIFSGRLQRISNNLDDVPERVIERTL